MTGTTHASTLGFAPLLPHWALLTLGMAALTICAYGLFRRAPGTIWRLLALTTLFVWLAGPQWITQTFRAVPMQALLVVDQSPSMAINNRAATARAIADTLQQQASHLRNLTLKTIIAQGGGGHGTRLFSAIDQADIAQGRFAGAILVTDGGVHDVPAKLPQQFRDAQGHRLPIHTLLTAKGEETDRRLRILQAPPFAIVGHDATLRVQVDDLGTTGTHTATLTITQGGAPPITRDIQTGTPQDITIPVTHPGETLLGLSASPLPGEVSAINNRDVVRINGVRDRLRVLLVSGTPNQGERIWRSLLKADPSVDLVHFTILRPPDKEDDTPNSDLALIPFPVRELFADKIKQFDLIILDGFQNRAVLPQMYLQNIADFVRQGGGLLLTAGPEFVQPGTLQDSPLGQILPAHVPNDGMMTERFQPTLTETGRRHPVTAGLPNAPTGKTPSGWGPWYRSLQTDSHQGEVLMNGAQGQPLLILDHVDRGRVALLLSDQIWLWSRGEGGGGPQAELLRRLSHWLMKEPELEENQLSATIRNDTLTITRHAVTPGTVPATTITSPTGTQSHLSLKEGENGIATGSLKVPSDFGIWRITDGTLTTYAAPQQSNPLENADLRATAEHLAPITNASGGAIDWTPDAASTPALHLTQDGAASAGQGWIGFPQRISHVNGDGHATPVLPTWLVMIFVLTLTMTGWWREGRRSRMS